MSALAGLLIVLAHLLVGDAALIAFGSAVSSVAGTWVAWWRLRRGLGARRVGLVEEGDVSRLIAAASLGSLVSAVGVAVTLLVAGVGNPMLALVAVFGTHAAAQLMLVPLFLDGPAFAPYAPRRERLVQIVLTLGVTVAGLRLRRGPAARLRGDADVRVARVPRDAARGQPAAHRGRHHRHRRHHAAGSARSTSSRCATTSPASWSSATCSCSCSTAP